MLTLPLSLLVLASAMSVLRWSKLFDSAAVASAKIFGHALPGRKALATLRM